MFRKFKYLKRLFRKYVFTGEFNIRLVVNHIIVLQNVFGVEAAVTLLLYKFKKRKEKKDQLPFAVFLLCVDVFFIHVKNLKPNYFFLGNILYEN